MASAVGDLSASVERYEAALAAFDELGLPVDLSQARISYGRALREFGELGLARTQFELARNECERMGAQGLLTSIEKDLALIGEPTP